MVKFIRLCSCELTKILKKKSTKIMLIILLVMLFLAAGMVALMNKLQVTTSSFLENSDYKENLRLTIESNKYELDNSPLDEITKNYMKASNEVYQFAIDNDINIYTSYWKADILNEDMCNLKLEQFNNESIGNDDVVQACKIAYDKYADIVKRDDFGEYIKTNRALLKNQLDTGIIDKVEYENKIYVLDLRSKYEIGKTYDKDMKWKSDILVEIERNQTSLRLGYDQYTNEGLSERKYEEINKKIQILEYRLEHNKAPLVGDDTMSESRNTYTSYANSFGIMIITIMMLIIAGGSISSEISKGTIKFWSFTPNKRWKILLSKLVVSVFILIVTTVGMSLISTVIGNVIFGASNAQGYLYVANGEVHEINYVVYSIIYNLTSAIEVFVFMVLAMMISTVFRNTAASVGISIALYFGGTIISTAIIQLSKGADWVKFSPLNNLSLTSRIFTNDYSSSTNAMLSGIIGNIPVKFSIIYLLACTLVMIITMFDSFRKKDIV